MKLIFLILFFICALEIHAQKPKDGVYTYAIVFEEWSNKPSETTCTVVIKGNSIKILHNGTKSLSGQKGDVIDQGIIMKHIKSNQWIIGHNLKDKKAKEIGGCSDGPRVIDFKHKQFKLC